MVCEPQIAKFTSPKLTTSGIVTKLQITKFIPASLTTMRRVCKPQITIFPPVQNHPCQEQFNILEKQNGKRVCVKDE